MGRHWWRNSEKEWDEASDREAWRELEPVFIHHALRLPPGRFLMTDDTAA